MSAGLLSRQPQQVQEQGGRKGSNFPGPGWEKRGKEGRETSVEVSQLLGRVCSSGALSGICGQA